MRKAAPGHTPPVVDHHGFELKTHSKLENQRVDQLHNVRMPAQWQTSPRYHTRSALRSDRAASMRPHPSFDVDGDGFVGQQDYSIAKKHDLGGVGQLTGGQRDSAIAETCYRMGSRLHESEIGGNARARRVLASLRDDPELTDTVRRENRLRVAGSARPPAHPRSMTMRAREPRVGRRSPRARAPLYLRSGGGVA